MSKHIRVGILGCAQIARRSLAPAFSAHAAFDLVAVASRSSVKAAEFISNLAMSADAVRPLSYDELVLAPDIDLVYCPLPTGMHHEWVLRALNAGKHVLCEKSLGCNYTEVKDMVEVARANKRFLMESFQFRFHAQNLYVKDLLAQGTIGSVRQLLVRFGIPPFSDGSMNIRYKKALGGGALLDNGAYTVKCATYLLGDRVKVLSAVLGGHVAELGDVDRAGTMMLLAGDVPVQTAYGFDHFYQNGYELWGTKGKITTTRAFTARKDFAAPVIVETNKGRIIRECVDDHFARLLDYLATVIPSGKYEVEYAECLQQAKILDTVIAIGVTT